MRPAIEYHNGARYKAPVANTGEDEDADCEEIGQKFPDADHGQNPEQEQNPKERIGGRGEGIGGWVIWIVDALIYREDEHVIDRGA